ncbi:hypothetical protein [Streptomyces sp. NPDC001851]|uniref:hypothetical protein n=1 Tax=Streptomyces sp. NPDC001851 TaxID=3154529 RepID=UPI003326EDC0
MISYLAASLPPPSKAEVRLLALQCALRSSARGTVAIPCGLIRGMALRAPSALWQELRSARWLHSLHLADRVVTARLTDPLTGMPGRRARARAADWGLRTARAGGLRTLDPASRFAALALFSHTLPQAAGGVVDSHQLARMCGVAQPQLLAAVQYLTRQQILESWSLDPASEDLVWRSWPP